MGDVKYFLYPCTPINEYGKVLEEMADISILAHIAVPFELRTADGTRGSSVDEVAGYVGVVPYTRGSEYCTIIFAMHVEYKNIHTFAGIMPNIISLAQAMGHDKILAHADIFVSELLHKCGWSYVACERDIHIVRYNVNGSDSTGRKRDSVADRNVVTRNGAPLPLMKLE